REEAKDDRRRLLVSGFMTLVASQLGILRFARAQSTATPLRDQSTGKARRTTVTAPPLPIESEMPSLDRATAWLNSPPLTAASLHGKVVIINFWTYTCINWLRSLPYVRAWASKYTDHGLLVIGVHAPEFSFEKDLDNVRRAALDLKVRYPIAVDNDHALWEAFGNRYWPALYFVDVQGRIRHHHFGEAQYERSEQTIQQL